MKLRSLLSFLAFAVAAPPLLAGPADVTGVEVKGMTGRLFQFDVKIVHSDEGWEHYVDQWSVLGPDATVLGTRTIFQPHAGQDRFSSSLIGVKVPEGVAEVRVQAHDTVHGYEGKAMSVAVP